MERDAINSIEKLLRESDTFALIMKFSARNLNRTIKREVLDWCLEMDVVHECRFELLDTVQDAIKIFEKRNLTLNGFRTLIAAMLEAKYDELRAEGHDILLSDIEEGIAKSLIEYAQQKGLIETGEFAYKRGVARYNDDVVKENHDRFFRRKA